MQSMSRSIVVAIMGGLSIAFAQPFNLQSALGQQQQLGMRSGLGLGLNQPIMGGGSSSYGGYGSSALPFTGQQSMLGGFGSEAIQSPSLSTSGLGLGSSLGGSSSDLSFQLSGSGESASQWANAAIGSSSHKGPKPIQSFQSTNQPIMAASNTLPVIELSPIEQTYNVPRTEIKQENIKQPITQPVFQPYLQRYVQRAQPILQPVVNRVVQPVIHRQLRPFLTSQTAQGDAYPQKVLPAQYQGFTNAPIVGAEYTAAPMMNMAQPPAIPQVAASVSKA